LDVKSQTCMYTIGIIGIYIKLAHIIAQ